MKENEENEENCLFTSKEKRKKRKSEKAKETKKNRKRPTKLLRRLRAKQTRSPVFRSKQVLVDESLLGKEEPGSSIRAQYSNTTYTQENLRNNSAFVAPER